MIFGEVFVDLDHRCMYLMSRLPFLIDFLFDKVSPTHKAKNDHKKKLYAKNLKRYLSVRGNMLVYPLTRIVWVQILVNLIYRIVDFGGLWAFRIYMITLAFNFFGNVEISFGVKTIRAAIVNDCIRYYEEPWKKQIVCGLVVVAYVLILCKIWHATFPLCHF